MVNSHPNSLDHNPNDILIVQEAFPLLGPAQKN